MRLESLGRITMRYVGASWHRPYGARNEGDEALGFGHGDGAVSGEIEGEVVWANYPRRRQDGVWTPNLRGMITAHDGHELLLSIHGQSVEEREHWWLETYVCVNEQAQGPIRLPRNPAPGLVRFPTCSSAAHAARRTR